MKPDDAALVEQTLKANHSAFAELMEHHKGAVYAIALQSTGDCEEALDITQDAFLQAWMRLSQLRNPSKFGPWLYQITANLCKMRARRISKMSERKLEEPPTYDPKIHERLELKDLLDQALQALSPEEQTIYTMYYLDGHTCRELAQVLHLPAGTIKRRLHEIRQQLRKEIRIMLTEQGILAHDVGIECLDPDTHERILAIFFPKGAQPPISCKRTFTTAKEEQDSVDIHIIEGNAPDVSESRTIGRFTFKNLSIAPKGIPQVDVTFTVQPDGTLSIEAVERPDRKVPVKPNGPVKSIEMKPV